MANFARYNEHKRLSERRFIFDIDKLLDLAAASISGLRKDVIGFDKVAEGGSYRVFEISFKDGQHIIARLPYPCTIPHTYGVASEVATIEYLRCHGVPAPEVLSWSNSAANCLNSEYIIMEKAHGKELEETWYTMGPVERKLIMEKVVDIESLLFKIKLPANGSLYFTHSLPAGIKTVVIPDNNAFCVGPSAEFLWWYLGRDKLEVGRGPWTSSTDVLNAVGFRELEWLRKYGKPRYPREPLYKEFYGNKKVNPDAQLRSLQDYLTLAPFIVPDEEYLNQPTIRHPDLSPSNIFVNDSGDISSIIDWEHTSILPLFLQAKIPHHFQNYGDDVSESLAKPMLPQHFASLSEAEKELELEIYRRRQIHYYYLGFTSCKNEPHFRAMGSNSGIARNRLYDVAGRPWEGDNTTLKATLINTSSYWPAIASAHMKGTGYPLVYSEKEIEECLDIDLKQRKANTQMQNLRDSFGVSIDGWTPNDTYAEAVEKMENMKAYMLNLAETEEDKQDFLENWPFQDHEEID
ncbi:hypothetical protein PRK78_000603 [Emydomyces testavorans]|uniref:non-specific serine/threonine protein kinase n=1 Tax=Emydomyces testavorans TaxID=2070801 RepID=A0AAF0DBR3_9EURO|nr:hypothetical protein PRK78_000603 [Emydomyces testavorans]